MSRRARLPLEMPKGAILYRSGAILYCSGAILDRSR
jgi:hypothetical protein